MTVHIDAITESNGAAGPISYISASSFPSVFFVMRRSGEYLPEVIWFFERCIQS